MTQAVSAAVSGTASGTAHPRAVRRFYVRMAWACAVFAFAGFTPTYWSPVVRGASAFPSLLHLHGLLFSAWTILFIVQATLAARERYERHRALGYLGIALATAMLWTGIAVAVSGVRSGVERGYGDAARAFSIVPVSIVLTFALAVAAALASVRRPETHLRLMLVATITILTPAFARIVVRLAAPPGTGIGFGFPPPPLPLSLVPSFLADLLLAAAMVRDWRTLGRPHPAYVVSAVVLVTTQVGRVFLGPMPLWHAVTDWLLRFGG